MSADAPPLASIPPLGHRLLIETPAGLRLYRVTLSKPMRVVLEPAPQHMIEAVRRDLEARRALREQAVAAAEVEAARMAADRAELARLQGWRWWRPGTWLHF